MSNFMKSTAVKAPHTDNGANIAMVREGVDTLVEKPSFEDVAPQEYKDRFPIETAGLSLDEIYEAVCETDDDMNDPDWKLFFLKVKRSSSPNVPNIDGDALSANAIKMAGSVGAESNAVIAQMADAKEVLDLGRFRLLFAMQGDFETEQLDGFPVPDTEEGNNPDHFKADKLNADGTTSKAWTTFYTVFADNTVMGRTILSSIEMLERLGNPQAIKDDISDELKSLDPHARENKLNYWKGRRGTLRKAYKEAMKLYFQFAAVNNFPGIKAEPMWAVGRGPDDEHADGLEIENTTKPIQVWLIPAEGKPVAKWEALSVSAFMKLNVKKAIEKGGTFAALIESGIVPKKKADGATGTSGGQTGNNAAATKLRVETATTLLDVLIETHRAMTAMLEDKQAVEYGKLLKSVNAKDTDETVTAFVELRNYLNDVCANAGLDRRYVALQTKGSELVRKAG